MRELWILAVLGIRERPNLAQNLVTHRHWWKNIFRAITLPLWRVFGQNLAIFAHFWAFSVTFLVVTAINMLTLEIRCTCIIVRHICTKLVWSSFGHYHHPVMCTVEGLEGSKKALLEPKMAGSLPDTIISFPFNWFPFLIVPSNPWLKLNRIKHQETFRHFS